MAYAIIEVMPAIHSTLIGFVGAFLCGIGVYALQKAHEATDRLTTVIERAKTDFHQDWYSRDLIGVILPDGRLDWNRFLRVMHTVRSIVLKDEYSNENIFRQAASEHEICAAFEDLWVLWSHAFIMYPFNGNLRGQPITEAAENLKQSDFDLKRISDIRERLKLLVFFRRNSSEKILALARSYFSIYEQRNERDRQRLIDENLAAFPMKPNEQEINRMSAIQPRSLREINPEHAMSEIFRIIDDYSENILPALEESFKARNLWTHRLPIKKIAVRGFAFTSIAMLIGVFLPPLITSVQQDFNLCLDFNWCWSPWMGYVLYVVSVLLYVAGAGYLLYKFRGSKDFD